jgi:hypothetical protein
MQLVNTFNTINIENIFRTYPQVSKIRNLKLLIVSSIR